MTIPDTEEFKHLASYIFGDGSPTQLYCSQAKVNTHRKLKAKLKSCIESCTDLEYTDPSTGDKLKLSDEDLEEINAIQFFLNFMQNETGTKEDCPLDITQFSCDDFTSYLTDDYNEDNPDEYDPSIARFAQEHSKGMEKMRCQHNKEMEKIRRVPTANEITPRRRILQSTVTHSKARDHTILQSPIEQTSPSYHTPLPSINMTPITLMMMTKS